MDNYKSEADLIADGFQLTPEVFHSGKGDGKLYAKSVPNDGDNGLHYIYFSVDPDGLVASFPGPAAPKEAAPATQPETPAAPEEPESAEE